MKEISLQLNKVNLILPGLPQPILRDISYSIYDGDFVILLGHNGSGKTSLLKILDRRYSASQGRVLLQGKELKSYSHRQLAQKIITITQNHQESLFTSLTILENCILIKQAHAGKLLQISTSKEREFFAGYLNEFNLGFPRKLDNIVNNLSGGEQQALNLALSVLYPPQILLLDEHTSALDPQTATKLMRLTSQMIHKHHITCVLSTHDLDLALNYGNRVLALAGGGVVQSIEFEQKKHLNKPDLFKMCY